MRLGLSRVGKDPNASSRSGHRLGDEEFCRAGINPLGDAGEYLNSTSGIERMVEPERRTGGDAIDQEMAEGWRLLGECRRRDRRD